ncbi:hypothetical protein ALSL_2145 [Aerosticca soli]|uniref:Uncharacterized protein n=1 Tax=Aerosticca soli TaxID=2010829 RepID=A0A2Z6E7T6_9GAMM|nr:hypothetical protein ALSL_2145 [Aerosticca soli]
MWVAIAGAWCSLVTGVAGLCFSAVGFWVPSACRRPGSTISPRDAGSCWFVPSACRRPGYFLLLARRESSQRERHPDEAPCRA